MKDKFFDLYCLSCDSIFSSMHLRDLDTCPICRAKDSIYPVKPGYLFVYMDFTSGEPVILEV